MATQIDPSAQPRIPLSRERVLAAAIELADEGGIESLTMRKLAQALGVEAMSLYNHVANKGDIVDAIVDRIVDEIELPADGDWETAIRTYAIAVHEALLRHPWSCSLVMSPSMNFAEPNARMRYIEWMLGRLREAGFSPELAYHGYHALDSHILGFTLWQLGHSPRGPMKMEDMADLAVAFMRELPPGEFPYLVEHIHQHLAPSAADDGGEFEFGLDLILEGLKRARG
jgi:AcrR family transcriptional regulator